jgi:shikimate kinase
MRHIVLVGLMGSGKTTVGARLAAALGWRHRDSDADLRDATGRTARELAEDDGIDRLHEMELQHLLGALGEAEPSVISAAASVIDEPRARAALDDPTIQVVWLRIDPATAARRAAPARGGDHRPAPEPLEDQARRRDPLFAELADVPIDVMSPEAAGGPDAVVERIIAALPAGDAMTGSGSG